MHLTPAQEKFYTDVEQAVLGLGGMPTKYHAFPLTIQTKAGVLRIRPAFDGIECQFDEPARALSQNVESHRMKGTWKFEAPMSPSAGDYTALIQKFQAAVKPLLLTSPSKSDTIRSMANTTLQVGQVVSAVQNGRETFTGKVTSIRSIQGRDHKLIKLEDDRGNYLLLWDNEATFVDPKDAPKERIPTAEERAKERSEYHSTYVGG